MAKRNPLKIGAAIQVDRSNVSASVREALGETIFWNEGRIMRKSGGRFMVSVCNQTAWFDAEALIPAALPN